MEHKTMFLYDEAGTKYTVKKSAAIRDGYKYCRACDRYKTLDSFHVFRNSPDGVQCYCKECSSGKRESARAEEEATRRRLIKAKMDYMARRYGGGKHA